MLKLTENCGLLNDFRTLSFEVAKCLMLLLVFNHDVGIFYETTNSVDFNCKK